MKLSSTLSIKAPRVDVFSVFSDIPSASERITGIKQLEVLSEAKSGQGVRWRETRVMFGQEATEEMEITRFDEPNSYVVEAESHGTHYTSRFSFVEDGGGATRVTWEFEGKPERRRGVDVLHFHDGNIIKKLTYSKTTLHIDGKRVRLSP